jgi:hypothetical protein
VKYLIVISLLLAACTKPAEQTSNVNAQFEVDRLFTNEGCTVYRFNDAGHHYYVVCDGNPESISQKSCGKGCVRDENIRTEYQRR